MLEKSLYTREGKILRQLLKACREQAGMTQEELALSLRVPPSRISDIEKAGRRLDLPQLKTYLSAMGIDIVWFTRQWKTLCDEEGEV